MGKSHLKKTSNTFARIRSEPIIQEKFKFQALLGLQEYQPLPEYGEKPIIQGKMKVGTPKLKLLSEYSTTQTTVGAKKSGNPTQ
jgi:hypothetical protein